MCSVPRDNPRENFQTQCAEEHGRIGEISGTRSSHFSYLFIYICTHGMDKKWHTFGSPLSSVYDCSAQNCTLIEVHSCVFYHLFCLIFELGGHTHRISFVVQFSREKLACSFAAFPSVVLCNELDPGPLPKYVLWLVLKFWLRSMFIPQLLSILTVLCCCCFKKSTGHGFRVGSYLKLKYACVILK